MRRLLVVLYASIAFGGPALADEPLEDLLEKGGLFTIAESLCVRGSVTTPTGNRPFGVAISVAEDGLVVKLLDGAKDRSAGIDLDTQQLTFAESSVKHNLEALWSKKRLLKGGLSIVDAWPLLWSAVAASQPSDDRIDLTVERVADVRRVEVTLDPKRRRPASCRFFGRDDSTPWRVVTYVDWCDPTDCATTSSYDGAAIPRTIRVKLGGTTTDFVVEESSLDTLRVKKDKPFPPTCR